MAKSEVACEVKEAFLGFDDVSNDRRAAAIFFLVVLPVSTYSCLFILHGVQPVLFSQFVQRRTSPTLPAPPQNAYRGSPNDDL